MAAAMLETPSRVWKRIQDVEGRDMPSLPSLPGFEDSASHPSEETDEEEDDLPQSPHPIHSTPAAFSHHTASTIRPPMSAGSTVRFAQSIASRSSKSSLSLSKGSVATKGHNNPPLPPDYSFDITSIPSLPPMHHDDEDDDMEIRSSDQDMGESTRSSVHEQYLPPDDSEEDELAIAEALQSVSRSGSPPLGIEPTPNKKKYDYSISLRSEPKLSPFDKLRNVSFRRPLSRTRTPSLTRETPSPASSSGQSTPHSTRSANFSQVQQPPSPTPAENIPLPRSATVSPAIGFTSRQFGGGTPPSARPTLYSRAQSASPFPAIAVPLPRSNSASPATGVSPRYFQEYEESRGEVTRERSSGDESSQEQQQEEDMSVMTDENGQTEEDHTEQHTTDEEMTSHQYTQQSVEQREPTFTSEEEGGMKSSLRESTRSTSTTGGGEGVMTYNHLGIGFSSPGVSALMTPTPAYHQPRPLRARFNVPEERSQESTTPPLPEVEEEDEAGEMELEDSEEGEQTGEVTYRPEFQQQQQQVNETFDPRDDPTTPYASHKKSFLLSVINSTARPRMKYPTPHPHRAGVGITRNDFLQTPGPGLVPATPGTVGGIGFQNSFAGVTPRPRGGIRPGILGRRVSHPLTQTFTPAHPSTTTTTTTTTESSAASVSGSEHDPVSLPSPAALPSSIMPGSPYIETNLPSFISTTSSQDLTTHARANASFDPVIGLGERGGVGVGRFNAPKLNNYLHGLNRKLQEENEGLVERLRIYEEKYGAVGRDGKPLGKASDTEGSERGGSSSPMNSPQLSSRGMSEPQQRRRSGGGRRVSAGPLGLVDVVEDEAEIWGEEKAALEEQIQDLRDQLDRALDTHRSTLSALDKEKNERARDKERWKERMGEVERGVEGIVRDLEEKQREAEEKAKESELEKLRVVKEVERRLAEVVVERDVLAERVEKAESALESGEDLGKEVNTANERVARIMGELKNANLRIREMEGEMESAEGKIDALEAELKEDQRTISRMEEKLRGKDRELGDVVPKLERLEHEFGETQNELEYTKAYVTELEEQAESAVERIQALDHQLVASEGKLEAMMEELDQEREKANHLEEETERAAEVAKQMEEALEEAENKMLTDEQELATLKSKVTALERELDKSRSVIDPSHLGDTQAQEDIEALEDELAQAHKEIAKLTTLVNQSPARKAIDKAKDSKIEILEKEREDLLERLRTLKNASMAFNTPSKIMNGSGISPMHRHVMAMSFKSPKTPGGPLRDMSWLQTTIQTPGAAPLVAEIERLQHELDIANESIDEKLDRLEDAGVGNIKLTNQLEDARARVVSLEEELGRLARREDRRTRRLERLRCSKCRMKVDLRGVLHSHVGDESSILESFDLTLPTEPPTPPTKTTEKLKLNLSAVNAQLTSIKRQWEEERQQLLGENAVLHDATKRLNSEVRSAKDEAKRIAENEKAEKRNQAFTQTELEQVKSTVQELENELKEERTRLRALTTEQTRAERQKDKLSLQLQRAESDMLDIKEQLQRIRHENHELEAELRTNVTVEQKARRLESKVAENASTMDQLRQERSVLIQDHKSLQKRYSEISELVNKLRKEHASSQTSHETRRQQLDNQVLEIQDLRKALETATSTATSLETQLLTVTSKNSDVARTIHQLESDLRRVRRDAEEFGREMRVLRERKERVEEERKEERERAERRVKQRESEIRILKEELSGQKERVREGEKRLKGHVGAADNGQLGEIKLRHNAECKGLIVQIRYLKAKFVRESSFREELGYQKGYLLALLAQSERGEQRILSAIARIGFPMPNPPPSSTSLISRNPKRKLKAIVYSVIFLQRTERASETWREHVKSKREVNAALEDVRRRRNPPTTTTTGTTQTGTTRKSSGSGSSSNRVPSVSSTQTRTQTQVPAPRRSEKAKGKQRER